MFEIGRLTRLELGYVGETESRSIQIDVSEWLERWPQAVIAIWVRRPDKTGYTAATEVEDGILTWNVTAGDVAQAGDGMAQIKALDPMDTGAIYKSRTVATKIYASLEEMSSDPDAPDPMESWANQAAIYKEEAYRAKEAAQAAAAEANARAQDAAESEARSEASAKSANDAAMAATDAANDAIQARQTAEDAQAEADKAAAAAAESAERAASAEKAAGDAAEVATSKANAAEKSASTAEEARREASAAARTAATEASAAATEASEAKKSAAAADLAREKAETNAGTAVQAMTRAEAGAAQSEQNAAEAANAKADAASAAEEATDSAANAKSNAEDAKSHAEAAAEHARTAEDAAKLAKESAADTAPAIVQQSSGEVVAISDSAARPALSLVSQIVAVQSGSGDPSPDNVRPITGWDSLTLTRTGRNMLDQAALRQVQISTGETRWGVQYTRPGTYALHANAAGGDADYVYARVTDGSGAAVGDTMYLVTGSAVRKYDVTLEAGQTLTVWYVRDFDQATAAECLARTQVQVEMGSRTAYVSGQSAAITVALPETVYGGHIDWLTGLLTVTHGHIAAYAGEDVPEGWISSVGSLTDGAQVVYPLAEPYTIQLDKQTLDMLRGDNTIWSDCGSTAVEYVADTKTYVDEHGGSVSSVNGKTGAVVLNAADVGAMPANAQIVDADAREQIAELKDGLANKLPKSPADWEAWTAEEQATAREQFGAIGKMRFIATVDVAELSSSLYVAKDADGKSIDLREIVIIGIAPKSTNGDATNGYVSIGSDGFTGYKGMFGAITLKSTAYETCWMCHIIANPNVPTYSEIASAVRPITSALINKQVSFGNAVSYFNNINKIAIYPNGKIEAGTKIFVLGVDRI